MPSNSNPSSALGPKDLVQAGRTPPSPQSSNSTRRPWSVSDIREVLAGVSDPAAIGQRDRKGLNATTYAVLQAAAATDSLLQLLDLLQESEESSKIDQVITLLEQIGASQIRIERRLFVIESTIGRLSASSTPPAPTTA